MSDDASTFATEYAAGAIDVPHAHVPPVFRDGIDSVVTFSKEGAVSPHTQKIKCLDDAIRSVDIIFYCQLSCLYYMDCSAVRFFIRALPHWFYFTPKPDVVPPIPPGQRSYIGTILATNALCAIFHLIFNPIAASELDRGYLHGGLMIDFVGQSSPVSRWRLLALDLLCCALQLLILGLTLEKSAAQTSGEALLMPFLQDHDAEEAGLLRSQRQFSNSETSAVSSSDEPAEDRTDIGNAPSTSTTGEYIVARLDLPAMIRSRWKISDTNLSLANGFGIQNAASLAGTRFTNNLAARIRNSRAV